MEPCCVAQTRLASMGAAVALTTYAALSRLSVGMAVSLDVMPLHHVVDTVWMGTWSAAWVFAVVLLDGAARHQTSVLQALRETPVARLTTATARLIPLFSVMLPPLLQAKGLSAITRAVMCLPERDHVVKCLRKTLMYLDTHISIGHSQKSAHPPTISSQ